MIGSSSQQGRQFSHHHVQQAPGSTMHAGPMPMATLPQGILGPERDDHLPPSSAQDKNEWDITSATSLLLTEVYWGSSTCNTPCASLDYTQNW
jgi:hypothetical protein